MKVLVTGANGFIGSHVARMLVEQGREVRAFVQRGESTENLEGLELEIVEGDLLDLHHPPKIFEEVDTLYHLAAIYALWLPKPAKMYQVNVEGSVRFLRQAMARTALKKVVYTSSIAAVGLLDGGRAADEQTPFNLWADASDYILSKYISELEVQRMVLQEGLPATIVNPGFPFGSQDLRPTPTGQIIVDVLNGRYPGYMDGGVAMVDVEDVARGHLLAEEKGKIGERYLLTGHNVSHKEFIEALIRLTGLSLPLRKLPVELLKAAGRVAGLVADVVGQHPPLTAEAVAYSSRYVYFDNGKARSQLGLEITPMEETMAKAVRWFHGQGYLTRPLPRLP